MLLPYLPLSLESLLTLLALAYHKYIISHETDEFG